jgi:ribosomal RNA-processing protein 12
VFELETTSGEANVVGDAIVKLLPILFKFVSQFHDVESHSTTEKHGMDVDTPEFVSENRSDSFQKVQFVTETISSLARLASHDFLHGLFKKLMHRLLEEIQSETSDAERICAFLNLSQALVASRVLDEANLSFLYRALKPLIRNDEYGARVQKRAYKVLAVICEKHHAFIVQSERLQELSTLLTGTIMTSQVAARHMRLKCLDIIVKGFDRNCEDQLVSQCVIPKALIVNLSCLLTYC